MLAELGSTTEARAEFDALAVDGFSAVPFDEEWEVSLCFLAEAAARLGEGDHAATLHEFLLPYFDRIAVGYPEISLGPVSRFLGLLASTAGRFDEAASHFEVALTTAERIDARPSLARTQDDYAHMLLRRGAPGDAEKTQSLLASARATYHDLGMGPSPSSIAGTLDASTVSPTRG
jgi:tetratricopeptide (TPR) repeat protein